MADSAATVQVPTPHKDLVHDVAFDFYGRRMATCGTDHTVCVYDQDAGAQWQLSSSFKVSRCQLGADGYKLISR